MRWVVFLDIQVCLSDLSGFIHRSWKYFFFFLGDLWEKQERKNSWWQQLLFRKETKCLKILFLKTSKCVLEMHLLTPSSSNNLHKNYRKFFQIASPNIVFLKCKEIVNVKVKGRSQPLLDAHVIIFGRLFKLVSLNDFLYSPTKQLIVCINCVHIKEKKNWKKQQTLCQIIF